MINCIKNLLPLQTDAALGYLAAAARSARPRGKLLSKHRWLQVRDGTHSHTHTNPQQQQKHFWTIGCDSR